MGVIVLTSCVCLSVCPSVHLAIPAKQTDTETWILAWMSSGTISRSSSWVKVKGQGHEVKKCSLGCSIYFWEPCLWTCKRRNSGIWLVGIRRGVFSKQMRFFSRSRWRSWLERLNSQLCSLTHDQKVLGSSPGRVDSAHHYLNKWNEYHLVVVSRGYDTWFSV